jgi:hypothetical protein
MDDRVPCLGRLQWVVTDTDRHTSRRVADSGRPWSRRGHRSCGRGRPRCIRRCSIRRVSRGRRPAFDVDIAKCVAVAFGNTASVAFGNTASVAFGHTASVAFTVAFRNTVAIAEPRLAQHAATTVEHYHQRAMRPGVLRDEH